MKKLKLNLNALRALDVLLREKNVTNAGKALQISQSAMSNALSQSRQLFNDELLIRSANGMKLTPQAEHIKERLSPLLKGLEDLIHSTLEFNPKTSTRHFIIGFYDHGWCSQRILPHLIKYAHECAPRVQFDIKNLNNGLNLTNQNTTNVHYNQHHYLDLMIGFFPENIPPYYSSKLYNTQLVCAGQREHPFLKEGTLENYLHTQHIIVSDPYFSQTTFTDQYIEERYKKKRKIAMRVASVHQAINILPFTPHLATLPQSLLEQHNLPNIVFSPPPFKPQAYTQTVRMLWDQRQESDQANQWLRETIQGLCHLF